MQSSSNLFPVALISAERRGDLSEDVYRLKPGNSPDWSVEIAVTRLGMADASAPRGVPVILLHGSFSNRRFWFSPKGLGLGAYLTRLGFDVWIPEMRGHGLSQRNLAYRHNRVSDYVRYDLPAIADFVRDTQTMIQRESLEIHEVLASEQRAIILGHKGERIKEIGSKARAELCELLGRKVHLFLHVKVKENWDEDRSVYRDMGLDWVD